MMPQHYSLMVAPNGASLSKADHPALPLTPQELAHTAQRCAQAGATAIHVHVRDDQGGHSLDPQRYRQALTAIAERTNLTMQITTEAAGRFDVETQQACLAQTECTHASIALREIARRPDLQASIYQTVAQRGIQVQHILFDPSEVATLHDLHRNGILRQDALDVLFVLGRYTPGQISTPKDLQPFLDRARDMPWRWSVCAFGPAEQACLLAALEAGGHARIGFENNRTAPDGTVLPNNETAVSQFVEAAANRGFTPYPVQEAVQ